MDSDSFQLNRNSSDEQWRLTLQLERERKARSAYTYDQAGWGSLKLVGNESIAINFPWGVYTYLICLDETTQMPMARPKTHRDEYAWFNISQVALKHPRGVSDNSLLPYARVCRDGVWADELLENGRTTELGYHLYTYYDTSQLNHRPELGALEKYRFITDSIPIGIEGATSGTVIQVANIATGKIFALKAVRLPDPVDEPWVISSYEISALRAVSGHQNICKLEEYFVCEDNTFHMVIEYGGDQTLRDKMESREAFTSLGLRPDINGLMACVMFQLCTAVKYIHSQGFIHCDIEPQNVIVTSSNPLVLKVANFSMATPGDVNDSTLHVTFGIFGYMAPELSTGQYGFDKTVDSYSVGVILYEMLRLRHNMRPTDYTENRRLSVGGNVRNAHLQRCRVLDCLYSYRKADPRPLDLANSLFLPVGDRYTMSAVLESAWIRDMAFPKQKRDSERTPYSSLAGALTMRL